MPVPAQTPNLANKEWIVFIKDRAFATLYEVYLRNFDAKNKYQKEYSIIWFRQMWYKLNEIAGEITHCLCLLKILKTPLIRQNHYMERF